MKLYLFLLSSLIFSGAAQTLPQMASYQVRPDNKLVNEISNKVARKLEEEYGLIPCGTGSQMIALSFDYYAVVNQEKARTLLLSAVNELVAAANQEEKIHPYLNNFPFGPKDVEIMTFLYQEDRSNHSPEHFAVVTSIGGVFSYKVGDPKKNILFTTVFTENYEEAMEKQAMRDKA